MAKNTETQFGVVRLSDDDRALLRAVTTAVATLKGKVGGGKGAAEAEDTGDGDGESGDGESGDGESGDGESGDGDDFEAGDGETEAGDAKPTRDDVRAALAAYANAPGKSKAGAIKLMEKIGGSNALSKLKEGKFQAVIDAAKKAAAKK